MSAVTGIYLDNAATTLHKPQQVVDAVVNAMTHFGNAGRGTHDNALDASRMIFDTRCLIASFFHTEDAKNVVFTSNATESLNIAIKGILQPGDHVITTALEHNSVLRPLYEMELQGVEKTVLDLHDTGEISYEELEEEIKDNTRAVIVTGASNVTGNCTDLRRIGEITRAHGILFIVDASQLAGCQEIDMMRDGIDVLCFTGHKGLYGPQGTGGLIVRGDTVIRPLKTGGSGIRSFSKTHPTDMPTALEAGTLNAHGIAGLRAAIEFINETGIDVIRKKELALAKRFFDGIAPLDALYGYGDFSDWEKRCPIISINIGEEDAAIVSDRLQTEYGIATRCGAHCAPLVHAAFNTIAQGMVRFSFSYFNTEEEVDAAIRAVHEITQDYIDRRQEDGNSSADTVL